MLFKGGYVKDDVEMLVDYLYEANTGRTTTFSSARIDTRYIYGIGCMFVSLIVVLLV